MKWKCTLSVIMALLMACTCAVAQNALVQLEFEDAEKYFNNGQWMEAIQHLDAVEKKAGVTSKTLYLRVMAENSLFQNGAYLYGDEKGFERLSALRTHARRYLNALSGEPIDDKYRAVYRIADQLNAYPENKQAWLKGKKAYQAEAAEKAAREASLKKAAALAEKKSQAISELQQLNQHQITLRDLRYNTLAKRVAQEPEPQRLREFATVVFYRNPVMLGRWVNTRVYINDDPAFVLATKCFKKLYFTPGLVQFGALHGTFKDREKKRSKKLYEQSLYGVQLEAGGTYYVDTRMVRDGHIEITRQAASVALAKIDGYSAMEEK